MNIHCSTFWPRADTQRPITWLYTSFVGTRNVQPIALVIHIAWMRCHGCSWNKDWSKNRSYEETDIFREKTTMAEDVTDCFAPGLYGISLVSHPSRTEGWMRKRIWGGQLFPDLKVSIFNTTCKICSIFIEPPAFLVHPVEINVTKQLFRSRKSAIWKV